MSTAGNPTVDDVVERLGRVLVLGAGGRLDAPVVDLVVTDPQFPSRPDPGSLVVAAGYRWGTPDCADLVAAAGDAGAAGVVVKGTPGDLPGRGDGVAVVVVDPAGDWARVVALLRAATTLTAGDGTDDQSLFAVVDAVASLCGGPVVVHDPRWELLAYSGGDPLDEVRSRTILGRRAPAEQLDRLRDAGVLDALARGEVVEVPDGSIPGLSHRFAVAVRAGAEQLGTVWLQPEGDLDAGERRERLRRGADLVALAVLRQVADGPTGSAAGDGAFAALLSGRRTELVVAERLVVPGGHVHGYVLCGLRPTTAETGDRAATSRRLVALARSHCDAFRVPALVAADGSTAYLLLALATAAARPDAVRVVADMHSRLQTTAPHRAMVSSTFEHLRDAATVREDVDDLLRLAEKRGWAALTDGDDVEASRRLERFRELALAHPMLLAGPVERLVRYDRDHGGDLVATLRAYFDAVGDPRRTAQALGLHPNTVRYRIGRIQEVGGFSLDRPDDRLLAELQVRLLR